MRISPEGLALVKFFEGLRLTAYRCPAGVLTIGYGSTGPHVKEGMTITEAEASHLLERDLITAEHWVDTHVHAHLHQHQFDALCSFAYNVGGRALADSTLLKLLNRGDYLGAGGQFERWVKGGGKTLPGLIRRREAERRLFCGEDWRTP